MMSQSTKVSVLNPLTFRNTVGAELADILEANGIENAEQTFGLKNLRDRKRLSKKALKKAESLLGNPNLAEYLTKFQQAYEKDKPRYESRYKKAKEAYSRVKDVLPLLRGEFTEGCDQLDDVLDFLGIETEDQIDQLTKEQAALFRTQKKLTVDPINMYVGCEEGNSILKNSVS